jgi:hypothetical protein
VGYIERPLPEVAEAVDIWRPLPGQSIQRYPDEELGRLLERLAPLESPYRRQLLVGTAGGWTAYFDNQLGGGDPSPWTGYLSGVLGCRGVTATHVPVEQYPYPATSFEIFSPEGEPPLMSLRTVHAGIYDEGRWLFETNGVVQPFERPALYESRLVRDRLTRNVLLEYLAAIGIEADKPDWYQGGVLYQAALPDRPRTLTIPQARDEYRE